MALSADRFVPLRMTRITSALGVVWGVKNEYGQSISFNPWRKRNARSQDVSDSSEAFSTYHMHDAQITTNTSMEPN
jgi:hypothetical protein